VLDRVFATPRPIACVLDGHPHSLAFLAAVHGTPVACLGVTEFGQSGEIDALYRHHGIDAETIAGAALDLL
jgi:pyruvate dehydrogenase E1 component